MEAILWKLRTGAHWRDVPDVFCPWKTAYNRFNRWAAKRFWDKFFLSYEEKLIQSGYSSTEVTSALISMQVELGIMKNVLSENLAEEQHIAADAHGNPLDFEITGGEIHDAKVADILIKKIGAANNFIADKGYDLETIQKRFVSKLKKRG